MVSKKMRPKWYTRMSVDILHSNYSIFFFESKRMCNRILNLKFPVKYRECWKFWFNSEELDFFDERVFWTHVSINHHLNDHRPFRLFSVIVELGFAKTYHFIVHARYILLQITWIRIVNAFVLVCEYGRQCMDMCVCARTCVWVGFGMLNPFKLQSIMLYTVRIHAHSYIGFQMPIYIHTTYNRVSSKRISFPMSSHQSIAFEWIWTKHTVYPQPICLTFEGFPPQIFASRFTFQLMSL